MNKIDKKDGILKDTLILGLAFFATMFGAGNLIFPLGLGHASGAEWTTAALGYLTSDVGLTILGVMAIFKAAGSSTTLGQKVHPKFGLIIEGIIIICLGPLIAIPRNGALTYELVFQGLIPGLTPLIFAAIYFSITLFFVIRPTGIMDKIGKYLAPTLIILVAFIIFKGVLFPVNDVASAHIDGGIFKRGFLEGYQTMDALGTVFMGVVLIAALREKGYKDQKTIIKMGTNAGLIAGGLLGFVYGGILFLASNMSGQMPAEATRPDLLANLIIQILGTHGKFIMDIVIALACLSTSIALTAITGNFFQKHTKGKLPYKPVVIATVIISIVLTSIGLDKIIAFAGPLLSILYPVTITLIILYLLEKFIIFNWIFPTAILVVFIYSLFDTLTGMGLLAPTYIGIPSWVFLSMILLVALLPNRSFRNAFKQ